MKRVKQDAWWFVAQGIGIGLTLLTKEYVFTLILAFSMVMLFVADLALENLEDVE